MDFKKELDDRVKYIEGVLDRYLPEDKGGYDHTVIEAMNYSVKAGGKRLRPMLMWECFKLFGGEGDIVEPFMAALEMIHTYSLVHDDLPCMDNDEYRRGRKTTHAVYGEGMAVLAGDGLLNYAFETACKAFDKLNVLGGSGPDAATLGRALQVLVGKSGIYGMIGGQCADVEAEDAEAGDITQDLLIYIHANKTAALIQDAMMVGAILAGAGESDLARVERIGYNIGIAFQIQDDILDVTSTFEELGKPIGSDEKNGKVTYVTLNGLDRSMAQVESLTHEALDMLAQTGSRDGEFLKELLASLVNRKK